MAFTASAAGTAAASVDRMPSLGSTATTRPTIGTSIRVSLPVPAATSTTTDDAVQAGVLDQPGDRLLRVAGPAAFVLVRDQSERRRCRVHAHAGLGV